MKQKTLSIKAIIIIILVMIGVGLNIFIPTETIGKIILVIAGIITILFILNDIKKLYL